jgi:hypothetical protein
MKKVILFLSDGGDCCGDSNLLINSLNNLKNLYKNIIEAFWCVGFGNDAKSAAGYLQAMVN